ncbi:unnamed protein product [Arabidopsis halleri]
MAASVLLNHVLQSCSSISLRWVAEIHIEFCFEFRI